MTPRVLVTTTSFIDTPGPHTEELNRLPVDVTRARGPLNEHELLQFLSEHPPFDGFLIGEDEFTSLVLEKISSTAKVISRYGVGLDRIDLETATRLGIQVMNTPGVNHTTVTELTFGLLLALARQIPEHNSYVHRGQWRRHTGFEIAGKTLGIVGFGRVGKEVARRAMAFGMDVLVFNTSWSSEHQNYLDRLNTIFSDPIFTERPIPFGNNEGSPFAQSRDQHLSLSPSHDPFTWDVPARCQRASTIEELLSHSHMASIHMNLTKSNQKFFNARRLSACRKGLFIVNVSRGALIDQRAMAEAIRSGSVGGFAADVLDPEPVTSDNPLLGVPHVILTPHIGSRTVDTVSRQGLSALRNLVKGLAL